MGVNRADKAAELFESCNCAQSVLTAYADMFNLDREKALQVASGFGGGIGRLQETCGAVTGAVMVLGLMSGFKEEDGRNGINMIYEKTRKLTDGFADLKGSIKCRDLLGCDLLTEEGQKCFREKNLRKECEGYIRLVCELLDEHLEE